MKNKFLYLIFSLLVVSILCSCSLYNSIDTIDADGLPTYKFNGKEYIDYKAYTNTHTLDLIKFGDLKDANVVTSRGVPIYSGNVWNYTNKNNDEIRVTYNTKNPRIIDSIYMIYNDKIFGTTPLYYERPFMTIDNWKKIHPIYNLKYDINNCIVYSNRYSYELNETFFKKLGFEQDIIPYLINYSKKIPLYRLSQISKTSNNKYRLYFISNYTDGFVNYYGEIYLDNNKLNFVDKNGIKIIENNNLNSNYYFSFLIEIEYIYDYISYTEHKRYNLYDDYVSVKNTRLSKTYPKMDTFELSGKYYAHLGEDDSKTYPFSVVYTYDKTNDMLNVIKYSCD